MHPKRHLEYIIRSKVELAVNDYLNGDWSRVQSLFTLSRPQFDAWADSVELPCGRVFRNKGSADGIYVLQDPEGWLVCKRQSGIFLPDKRLFATYKEAKRAALTWEFLEVLRGTL